jgi:CheY-like chemotaxis protein
VREIVEAHAGTVGVSSAPGAGSTFWFRVPRHQRARDNEEPERQCVLIVDDDRDLRETLRFLLEAHGYGVVEAENGEQGLRALDEHRPCAVFADLTMPVMDGWEFIERLRRSERHAAVPVCILSSIANHAPATASVVLAKPIPVEDLLTFLRDFCPPARARKLSSVGID